MEFFYEEEVLNKVKDQQKVDKEIDVRKEKNHDNDIEVPHLNKDERTNHIFDKLEDQIGDVYEKTVSKLKEIVNDVNTEGLAIPIPLIDEETSTKAQKYIETLDNNLASMENAATSYWNKMSKSNFWSNVTQNLTSQFENTVNFVSDVINNDFPNINSKEHATVKDDEKDGKVIIGGSRTETELKNLSNNKLLYLEYQPEDNFKEITNIKDRTQEIDQILKKDKDLETLMNKLVPDSITYTKFWSIYLYERARILDREDKRLKLLANEYSKDKDIKEKYKNSPSVESVNKVEEMEEVGWGDEEDDDDDDSSVVIVKKEDVEDSSKPSYLKNVEDMKKDESNKKNNMDGEGDDDDDDDDDWE